MKFARRSVSEQDIRKYEVFAQVSEMADRFVGKLVIDLVF
jgi:hypothetical protein